MRLIDLTGQRFGRLTVIERAENKGKQTRWRCKCDCGNETIIRSTDLTSGASKSCGCLRLEKSIERAKIYFKDTGIKYNKKYNRYDLSGEFGIGFTQNNIPFYFDLVDYDKIKDYCWHINDSGYLISHISKSNQRIRLHRLVMGCVPNDGLLVDHINHDTLDNRKSNLRIVNYRQNAMNMIKKETNTSGATGVSWDKEKNKWCVSITDNYKTIFLGYYFDFNEAVEVRKQAEQKYFGEYSYENSMKIAEQNEMRKE